MKQIIRRLASSGLAVKMRVKVGCNCVDLVDDGSKRLLLNGYDTIGCSDDVQDESFAALLTDMIAKMFNSGTNKAVVMLDGGSDGVMRSVAKMLGERLGKKSISSEKDPGDRELTISPAEHKVDMAVNPAALATNAGVLANKAASVASAIKFGHDAALMMSRKKLVASMWGAEKIQAILDRAKERVEDARLPWARVSVSADMLAKSASRLQRKMTSDSPDDRSMVANVLIPGINDGYCCLKAAAEAAAVSFVPLVYIDAACKESTTYPATWFFDQDIMDGVSQGYDGVLDFLVQVPAMEAKVVDPLSSVRMRLAGEAR
jgi:hypothetical protein